MHHFSLQIILVCFGSWSSWTSGFIEVYTGHHSSVLDSNGPCANICMNQQRDPQEMADVINHVIDHPTELLSGDKDRMSIKSMIFPDSDLKLLTLSAAKHPSAFQLRCESFLDQQYSGSQHRPTCPISTMQRLGSKVRMMSYILTTQ